MKTSIIILTRFNLKLYTTDKNRVETLSDKWMQDRFDLFYTYCLPSVKNQSIQLFKWICLFSDNTSDYWKGRILDISNEYKNFCPCYLNDIQTKKYMEYINETIRCIADEENADRIITIRLDNDDAIHESFVESVFTECEKLIENTMILSFKNGIQYFVNEHMVLEFPWESNHFLILVQDTKNIQLNNILSFNHYQIKKSGLPFRCLNTDLPMWMEIVHSSNVVNDIVVRKLCKIVNKQALNNRKFDFGFNILVSNRPLIYQYLCIYFPKYINKIVRKTSLFTQILHKS